MIREVDSLGQAVNRLNGFLPQRRRPVNAIIRPDYQRNDKVQIFFNVRSKGLERVENLNLRADSLVIQFPIENLQNQRDDRGEERLEFSTQCFTECFDEGHDRELERDVVPDIGNEIEDNRHIITDVLLDDSHQDG